MAEDASGAVERRRGRPRVAEDTVRVSVRVPAADYDRLYQRARVDGDSVPEAIRKAISVLNNPQSR